MAMNMFWDLRFPQRQSNCPCVPSDLYQVAVTWLDPGLSLFFAKYVCKWRVNGPLSQLSFTWCLSCEDKSVKHQYGSRRISKSLNVLWLHLILWPIWCSNSIFAFITRRPLLNHPELIFTLTLVIVLPLTTKGQKILNVIFMSARGTVCAVVCISDPRGKTPCDNSVLSAVRQINVYCSCCCCVSVYLAASANYVSLHYLVLHANVCHC